MSTNDQSEARLLTPPSAFTAHNIALPGGELTCPEYGLIAESALCQSVLRTLRLVFGPEATPDISIADLGCLEGGYTAAFAEAGYSSVGIEVRSSNIERCAYVARRLSLPNLRFVQDDVRNVASYGSFDAVFCCGLLYHLDQPRAFLETLAGCTRRVLILQTHVASDEIPPDHAPMLSPMSTHEGNQGRWYREFPGEPTQEMMEDAVWSSWGNHQSFWIEKRHLLQNLREVGFDCVYEQFDFVDDLVQDTYWAAQGRGMFVAVKLP